MEQPPRANDRRQQHQPEDLVAPELPTLLLTPRFLGLPFQMRLDAGFHHRHPIRESQGGANMRASGISIGEHAFSKVARV